MEPLDVRPDLRTLHILCGAMAASMVLLALTGWLALRSGARSVPALPGLPLSLTSAAVVLILLASRIRSGLLRRAVTPWAAPGLAAAFAVYRRATVASFALLAAAGVLGLILALVTGSARNVLVLCAASLIGMLVRWPRAAELTRLARRRAELQGIPPTRPA